MTRKGYVLDVKAALFKSVTGGAPLEYTQQQAPGVPTNIANGSVTSDGWTTTWSPPTTGSAPDGYRVLVNGTQVGGNQPSTARSLLVSGQAPGTYDVTMKAFSVAFGDSALSAAVSVTVLPLPPGAPDPPLNVANGSLTASGWTTTWSPPTTGPAPTGYRIFINGTKYGNDLPVTPTSVAVTGQSAGTYNVKMKSVSGALASVPTADVPVTLGSNSNFPPGLFPGRVVAGWFAAPASMNNDWQHAATIMDPRNTSEGASAWWQTSSNNALTIPASAPYRKYPAVAKQFQGDQISSSQLLGNLADADREGWFLCQTSKVVNDDWQAVGDGTKDSYLDVYVTIALNRINATPPKRGFALTYHHEPYGKDINGTTRTYATWAAMQIHCSYYMAGWRNPKNPALITPSDAGRVYHPELDTRPGLSWMCIPNGFLFTGGSTQKAALDSLIPADLITALNTNHGIVSPDIYDAYVSNKMLADKVTAAAAWCRKRGVNHLGFTEFGTKLAANCKDAWAACKVNADLVRYAVYWDDGVGHQADGMGDMRLLPNGYPADTGAPALAPEKGPGTAATQASLIYWRDTAIPDSEAM